jgi:hypothetical protein
MQIHIHQHKNMLRIQVRGEFFSKRRGDGKQNTIGQPNPARFAGSWV